MYKPEFTGPLEGWATNHAKANFWRVKAIMEWDDLLQDAYYIFLKCRERYTGLHEAKHFMSLYQRAYRNHVTDLSWKASEQKAEVPVKIMESGINAETIGETDNEGYLAILLRQAPREVTMVLNLVLNAPQELIDAAFTGWRGSDKRMTNGGTGRVNAALGLDPEINVMQMVNDHFMH